MALSLLLASYRRKNCICHRLHLPLVDIQSTYFISFMKHEVLSIWALFRNCLAIGETTNSSPLQELELSQDRTSYSLAVLDSCKELCCVVLCYQNKVSPRLVVKRG